MPTHPRFRHTLSLLVLACHPEETPTDTTTSSSSTSETTDTPPPVPTTTGGVDVPSTTGGTSDADTTVDPTSTGDATTGDPPLCGNGLVDPGEQCDLSWQDNSDKGYCKTDCTVAYCGDGDLWVGVESCDQGADGNTGDYAGCNPDCSLANFCGDGVPHPYESCDAGEFNGTGVSEEGFVGCSTSCGLEALRVAVSSVPFDGNLGGLTGADEICQDLVDAAGWPGDPKVLAWLSDGNKSALERISATMPSKPYALVNGRRVAGDLASLIADGPGDGIDLDEYGTAWTAITVWTNTAITGEAFSPTDHCFGWTSASPDAASARVGLNAVPKLPEDAYDQWSQMKKWTSSKSQKCHTAQHLYCVEVEEPTP
jgi:hypothetical protein